jgi:hypothetical protein
MAHDDPAGVAREAPRRFRGNVLPAVEDRLPGLIGVGERRRIDVDQPTTNAASR